MKFKTWYYIISIILIVFSAIFYLIQIAIFHKSEDTFFYMFQDLAFVPVQVLLVTLILDRLMKKRETQSLLNKMNMVIGVFYNEIGYDFLKLLEKFTINFGIISRQLQISVTWDGKDFINQMKKFTIHPDNLKLNSDNLKILKKYLANKKHELLNMLANPNLLEHESFTNLLWAVFHITDELMHREKLDNLPQTDLNHLKGDLIRTYKLIVHEWLSYMKHLKKDYPYLYSLAMRTNPFNPEAEITVLQ
ncbi:MAG: hypothetical protein JXN64_05175 [Spirochaetes bacterium]|nr:hypothetical protein [Spirochaetota bacterium]